MGGEKQQATPKELSNPVQSNYLASSRPTSCHLLSSTRTHTHTSLQLLAEHTSRENVGKKETQKAIAVGDSEKRTKFE